MAEAKLARYQEMRDFTKTAEPSGNEGVLASKALRFVIQKHAASHLHFDLRLEFEGTFRSWAVPKGPSLDPHDRRLAMEVEDHPLAYGDFEGTIPPGEYGGGTVMLWDRGFWAPEKGFENISKALAGGELKFVMEGERMHGSWVLVRTRRDSRGRASWILIKHRDAGAASGEDGGPTDDDRSVASHRTMSEIAAGSGNGASPFMTGAGAPPGAVWRTAHDGGSLPGAEAPSEPQGSRAEPPTAEPKTMEPVKALRGSPAPAKHASAKPKAARGPTRAAGGPDRAKAGAVTLPEFIEPQLTKSLDRPPAGPGWCHEIKFDGYRMQMRVVGGRAVLRTRKGLDWSERYPEIAAAGARLPEGIYDGEIVALDGSGAPDFAALQAAVADRTTKDLVFFIFDLLFAGAEDRRDDALSERKARLLEALADAPPALRYVDHFITAGDAVLLSACRMHLEGIVSKRLDAPYRSGRGESWAKSKCRAGHEVVVGGYLTTGGAFRSLIAGVWRDGRLVEVGRVGTGFGRDKVARILPKLKALETDISPFDVKRPKTGAGELHWVRPELVAEIEYEGFTAEGLLRQAAFKGLREDKPASEVDAVEPAPSGRDPKGGDPRGAGAPPSQGALTGMSAQTVRPGGSAVVMGVTLSHADKPFWPDDGDGNAVTKLDLARYYEAVGPWLIDHVRGRPCSIVRFPDGIAAEERFFQRHTGKGQSALITSVTVWGDRKPYLQFDRVEALIAAAQAGALELHPWNCQPFEPEQPGRLVFDLDPAPDVEFDEVVAAAREVRERLEAVGLVSFCKTTGGKGLHVVTPLSAKGVDWPAAKGFAMGLCNAMAKDSPERYLINMAKAKRTGRIFLDYLRNDRMATAVAPLSPRGRPFAPVSMPLQWTQVRKGLDPARYTLRTVPALLGKLTAWSDYCEGERPLGEAIARLART